MPPNFEPKGTGVNKLQYWATNDCNLLFFIQFSVWGMEGIASSYTLINNVSKEN